MKKFFMIIALLALLIPSISLATTAITCTEIPNIIGSGPATELVLKCTGDQDTTVTIASSMDSIFKSSGIATISLLFSSTPT